MATKKNPKLVTQYLEGVSRELLSLYPKLITEFVGSRNGIYALYKGSKLYYVGLAKDLNRRLGQHLKNQHAKEWDGFSVYLTIGNEHMPELEAMLVRIIEPPGNSQMPRLSAAQDVFKLFEQSIKDEQRKEREWLLGYAVEDDEEIKEFRHHKPIPLRATIGKRLVKATMRRDGAIRYGGEIYKSPSAAASAACESNRNGWSFWKYQRAPGDWILIDNLRR